MSEFRSATRQQTSLLTGIEKRTLIAIARRLPGWVNSDHLTALGFAGLVGAGGAYWYSSHARGLGLALVVAALIVNWFGDSLDGTVARVRDQQRPRYGFYIDHVLDSIGTAALAGGLALSGLMSPVIAALFLIVYLLVSIETFLATYALGEFQMSYGFFGPTELRVLLVIGNAVAWKRPEVVMFGARYLLFDVGFACGIVGLAAILVWSTVGHTRRLYREETRH